MNKGGGEGTCVRATGRARDAGTSRVAADESALSIDASNLVHKEQGVLQPSAPGMTTTLTASQPAPNLTDDEAAAGMLPPALPHTHRCCQPG